MKIKTENGYIEIIPLLCEITGKQICWQTKISYEQFKLRIIPIYISFNAVSLLGIVNQNFKIEILP